MKKKNNNIDNIFESSSNVMLDSKKLSRPIENSVTLITKSIKNGNKIILFGNGGSATDAQHMAAEFVGRFMKERKSFPAIALSADSSIITAIGNDYGYDKIFARQIEGKLTKNDVFLGITTSVSGSPILTLYSITLGSPSTIIKPKNMNPW